MNENRTNTPAGTEDEIDLMALLFALLHKAGPILVTAVVCALLLGGAAGIKGMKNRAAGAEGDQAYEEALDEYNDQKAECELTLEEYDQEKETYQQDLEQVQQALEQARKIRENSLWAQLDASDTWTAQADLYLGAGSGTTAVLSAYQSRLLTGEALQQAAEAAGLKGRDLTGAVTVTPAEDGSGAYSGVLTLRACAGDQVRAEALLDALLDQVRTLHGEIAAAVSSHEVQLIGRSVSRGVSDTVLSAQQADRAQTDTMQAQLTNLKTALQTLEDDRTEAEKELNGLSEPVRSQSSRSAAKYGAMGFVVGFVLACGVVAAKMLMSGLICSASDLTRTTGLDVLGRLASDRTRKAKGLDAKLDRMEGRPDGSTDGETLCLMAQTIRSRAPEAKNILITGDLPSDQLEALAAALQAAEALRGQKVTAADCILKTAATVPHAAAADAIVLAADCTVTRTDSVREQQDKIARLGRTILGCVVYE